MKRVMISRPARGINSRATFELQIRQTAKTIQVSIDRAYFAGDDQSCTPLQALAPRVYGDAGPTACERAWHLWAAQRVVNAVGLKAYAIPDDLVSWARERLERAGKASRRQPALSIPPRR